MFGWPLTSKPVGLSETASEYLFARCFIELGPLQLVQRIQLALKMTKPFAMLLKLLNSLYSAISFLLFLLH